MSAAVTKDVPPYSMFFGVPGVIRGANTRGMAAHGFEDDSIVQWDEALKKLGYEARPQNKKLNELFESWLSAVAEVQLNESERH
jgi:acyl-[acyl carrier protein]--UDP-N-acetylglucosamine O-acyltransferase